MNNSKCVYVVFWKYILSLAVYFIATLKRQDGEKSRRSQLMEWYHSFYSQANTSLSIKRLFHDFSLLVFIYFLLLLEQILFFFVSFTCANLFIFHSSLIGIVYRLWKMKSNLNMCIRDVTTPFFFYRQTHKVNETPSHLKRSS